MSPSTRRSGGSSLKTGGTAPARACGCASNGIYGADPGIFQREPNEGLWAPTGLLGTKSPRSWSKILNYCTNSNVWLWLSFNFRDGAIHNVATKFGGGSSWKLGGHAPDPSLKPPLTRRTPTLQLPVPRQFSAGWTVALLSLFDYLWEDERWRGMLVMTSHGLPYIWRRSEEQWCSFAIRNRSIISIRFHNARDAVRCLNYVQKNTPPCWRYT